MCCLLAVNLPCQQPRRPRERLRLTKRIWVCRSWMCTLLGGLLKRKTEENCQLGVVPQFLRQNPYHWETPWFAGLDMFSTQGKNKNLGPKKKEELQSSGVKLGEVSQLLPGGVQGRIPLMRHTEEVLADVVDLLGSWAESLGFTNPGNGVKNRKGGNVPQLLAGNC